jgi:uncharacterized protein YqeY
MTLEKLQSEKIQAMKSNDKLRNSVLSGLIDAVKKASITNKGRVEITEQLVGETLLKYKKIVEEQVATCPADRVETLAEYKAQLAIVAEFAPSLITDETDIELAVRRLILDNNIEPIKSNRGAIMKIVAANLKGKADMSIVSKVVGGMLQ